MPKLDILQRLKGQKDRKGQRGDAGRDKQAEQAEDLARLAGWTVEQAEAQLAFARALDIDYKTYVKYGYWNVPIDELEFTHVHHAKRRAIAKQVAREHHKDPVEIERQMIEAKYKEGLRYEYFRNYDWDILTPEERETIFLRPHGRKLSKKYRKPDAKSGILNKKDRFYAAFPECVGRKWFLFEPGKTTFEAFCKKLDGFIAAEMIYKPEGLSGGEGIKRFKLDEPRQAVFDEISQGGKALVEECVVQHPAMDALCPDSVNTVRVVSLCWGGNPPELLYAGCRMGVGNGSPVDSVRQGGMSAGVDLETGRISTIGAAKCGDVYEVHPKTGTKLVGFQIPMWDQVLELVRTGAVKALDVVGVGYVGWDIAITENGPIVIEANNWPSPSLAQLPWFKQERRGLRPLVDRYLQD